MSLNVRFAIASDLHIALPHTIPHNPHRFHRVELSTHAFEAVLDYLAQLDLDFLLLPGDLTQDGEPDNHAWVARRLAQLPYPVYVVPGNHDAVEQHSTHSSIGIADFPSYYSKFGYSNPGQLYYSESLLPGIRLIGLNSIAFDDQGKQLYMGRVDEEQLVWLHHCLEAASDEFIVVMIHHNVIEHLPGQTQNPLGRRYMLENAPDLLNLLRQAGVRLICTGHLHVQDIAHDRGIYDITTGSLVSYPHPFRVLQLYQNDGHTRLQIESHRIQSLPGWDDLQTSSRELMGDRSVHFMMKLLMGDPLNLSYPEAKRFAPDLRYFWADIAHGDAQFSFPQFPLRVRRYFEQFGALDETGSPDLIDNSATLLF
ncbi:MAG: metallophosphoesterase family protein [Elainellaceae cyanobacterium]